MQKIAVLFDMDGTLVDSEGLHHEATVNAVNRMGYSLPEHATTAMTGLSSKGCHQWLQSTIAFKPNYEDFVEEKNRHYLASASHLKRRLGVDAALALLESSDISFAVVSNSVRAVVDANLRATRLWRDELITISIEDVVRGKPDPEPFLKAASLLGRKPEECLVIEDSVLGALAGHAAGMTVIGWAEPHRIDLTFPQGTFVADPTNLVPILTNCLTSIARG
ncbi:HAD family hydrolase [Rhizobium sp. 11515TR]|uniref:HAD family hydrolase n=1 Tax=Rhizobium sp. 11515TR TaxID=2028343 RepID=UPI00130445D5|nr:HAD family phosphatase [Rhizobium sp. 11515TR]